RIVAEDAVRALRAEHTVRYAEPNRKLYADGPIRATAIPNDPLFESMWGLNNTGQEFYPGIRGTPDADIDAPEAWDMCHDAPAVVVADIDTGIQWNHPDLQANIWVNEDEFYGAAGFDDDHNGYVDDIHGWDFVNEDNTVYDGIDAHGTHTAGTVGAVGNNALGVTGVAWNVKIMCLKFLEHGWGNDDDAIEAFAYAWNNGANLTTNSWGGGDFNQALQDAMWAAQIIHVCAAGNSASNNDSYPHYPSSYELPNIIAVAASDWNDELASFSCYGATSVDLAAPGHRILSTVPTDRYDPPYAYSSGTSMATPHVAGAVAILMTHFPTMPPYPGAPGAAQEETTIKDLLLATVDRKDAFAGKLVSGGRLNLRNALIQDVPPIIDSAEADPVFGSPPLAVNFTATAHDDDGTVIDVWWDFGDGSPEVHEYNASHTYGAEGSYVASFHAVDDDLVESVQPVTIVVVQETTVIFVDDDGGAPYETYFTQAMDAIGIDYVVVTPPLALPTNIHNAIIWNCGYDWSGTLTPGDQAFLSEYLDNGGRLFLSAQDLIWDIGVNEFVRDYLHVSQAYQDYGTDHVYGVPGDPITDGLSYTLSYPFSDYSDIIIPDSDAAQIFTNDWSHPCALRYAGACRVVFLAFPFEAIPYVAPTSAEAGRRVQESDLGGSALLMWRIFHWLAHAPIIDSASVAPLEGYVPLEVTATAVAHDPDGTIVDQWWDFGDGTPPVHEFTTTHTYANPGVYTVTFHVQDNEGMTTWKNAGTVLAGIPRISVSPNSFKVSAVPGTVAHRQLDIASTGYAPLRFMVTAFEDFGPLMMERAATAESVDPNATDSGGVWKPLDQPLYKPDVGALTSWPVPYVTLAWGCGFDGAHVWVSDPLEGFDISFSTDGAPTGFWFDTTWAPGYPDPWPADFAWDGRYLWQVKVGGGNGIYALEPASGAVVAEIHDPDHIWDAISQRGLTYDPVEDVFFIGGWNEGKIYKIAGLSWPEPGKIQRVYDDYLLPIAGIARLGWYLVITTNSYPDLVVIMDSMTGDIVTWFQHPGGGYGDGAGCETDRDGNVWMTYQNNMAYLLDLGSIFAGIPSWLGIEPKEGLLDPGESMGVDVAFNTEGLEMGVNYTAQMLVISNARDYPVIFIPTTFRLDTLTAGFTWSEAEPNTVTFIDTSTDPDGGGVAAWNWDFGDGATSTEQNPVHRYAANGHYHVTLTVTDADGAVASAGQTVIVANTAPVAAFSAEETGPVTVQFTDESTDVDGTIVAWSWNFGDGSPVSNAWNPVHVYAAGGTYNVTLTITDNDGTGATVTKAVKVNALPVVQVISPVGGDLWVGMREIMWTATDADDAEEDLVIKLDCSGDGGATWKLIADEEANDGCHMWDTSQVKKGGRYIVKVTATDPHGGVGEDTSGEFTIVVLIRTVMASPNPARDNVTFYYDIDHDGTLYVYDIAGRLVHSAELDNEANAYEWNLASGGRPLANGLYLYLVVTEDGQKSEVGRLVVSR
ncbi:MAG: PKD domain-containing protein, partial [Bacillota bacterium]